MLDDEKSKEFRKNKHRVSSYVNGQLDMSGPRTSGVPTGVQQQKIMQPTLDDELFKHIAGTGYDSKPFPEQSSES